MMIQFLIFSTLGFFTIGTDSSGLSTLVRPDGEPMYLSGAEHLFKQQAHEFANTNWENEVVANLKAWNFTSLGAGPQPSLRGRGLPYTQIAWIAEAMTTSTNADDSVFPMKGCHVPCTGFPNVYSPRWEEKARAWAARHVAPFKDDVTFIGWYLDNELRWFGVGNMSDNRGLYRAFAELKPDHSGRRALEAFLAARGQSVSNATEAVQLAFVDDVCERFFSVACRAMREADPNHLILGVRFAGFAAPDAAWRACGKWCDAVSFNVYPWVDPQTGEVINQCCSWNGTNLRRKVDGKYALCRKPMVITEWATSAIDSGLPCTKAVGQRFRTQTERTAAAERILYEFLAMPYLLGYNWYRYRDNRPDGTGENCNWGLVDRFGKPYPELTAMLTRVNADAVRLHRELAVEGKPIPFKSAASDCLRAPVLPSDGNADLAFSAGSRTPIDKIRWRGKDFGFVDLRVSTRRTDGKSEVNWNNFPQTVESVRGTNGSLTVASELRNPRDAVALRFVTRWTPGGKDGCLLGELLSIQNVSERDKTLTRLLFDLVPPFAATASATNAAYSHINMTRPLLASAWIAPDETFAGALSCAPLADAFNFRYDHKAGNGKGWPYPDAGFRLADFGQDELTLRPGETWTAGGRLWVLFAFGTGGVSGWNDVRDAFELKQVGALSRIPTKFPLKTRPGHLTVARGHIQGIDADDTAFYASTAESITKFDWTGRMLDEIRTDAHTGDLCCHSGRVYAVCSDRRDKSCHVRVYDANLKLLEDHVVASGHGLDGIAYLNGSLYTGYSKEGKTPHGTNYFLRLDPQACKVLSETPVDYGHLTAYGPQCLTTVGDRLFAIFYPAPGEKCGCVELDADLNVKSVLPFVAGHGFCALPPRFAGKRPRFLKAFTDYDWQKSSAPDFDRTVMALLLRAYELESDEMKHRSFNF